MIEITPLHDCTDKIKAHHGDKSLNKPMFYMQNRNGRFYTLSRKCEERKKYKRESSIGKLSANCA